MKLLLLVLSLMATVILSASAQPCYDLELVEGTTTSSGTVSCQVEDAGWTIGIPTPWGTFGWKSDSATFETACALTVTIVPPTYQPVPGDHLVRSDTVDGVVKTYAGCSLSDNGAVCEYDSTTHAYQTWKVVGPCESLPPQTKQ